MKRKILLIFLVVSMHCLFAQKPMFEKPLSPRIANYDISVTLIPDEKKLVGSEILTWRNDSKDVVSELHFHLYYNAFKNEASTFLKERDYEARSDEDEAWGWINIEKMETMDGKDLIKNFEFIHPDDDNENDQTVLRVKLDKPVQPQKTIQLKISFTARLPNLYTRTRAAYKDNFFMVGQWFPKIGVYEEAGERYAEKGQWNCHQFHANTEFFSDFGVYDVKITLPEDFIVGATGALLSKESNGDGSQTLNYYCEDVHDFAWTADKDYVVIEDQWKDVKIIFLSQPEHEKMAQRQITAAKRAMEYCDEWYGPYPYPTLTIVDPQYGLRMGAGGMEYPTLITGSINWIYPEGIKLIEDVIVHEFAHNYWYGMVASNEFEEAWLDEGFTTYAEKNIMDKYYGADGGSVLSLFGLNINNFDPTWTAYIMTAKRDAIYKYAWEYKRGGYGTMSYFKPAVMLFTLENYLGKDIMKKILQTYFSRFKFRHPCSRDFIRIVNEVSGQNLDGFFNQVLYGTDILDYKIDQVSYKNKSVKYLGVFGLENSEVDEKIDTLWVEDKSTDSSKTIFTNKIVVAREGEVIFPVEVLIKFDNGEEIFENWDGKDRYKIYEYEKDAKVVSAEVDPERKIWLDVNFLNNGKTIKSNTAARLKYSNRWFFWMQNILHIFSIFS